jgi:phosphoglycolate phosphatase
MKPRLVLFDFDGTLLDSFPWFLAVFNELADRYGFQRLVDGEVDELRGLGGRELVSRIGVARWKLPLIARRMRAAKARDLGSIELFPGVGEMLRRLRRERVQIAMVSSDSQRNVAGGLGERNAALIDHWACGSSLFGKAKAFRKVLAASGVTAAEALAVGDEIRDLEAARAVGIPFAGVAWGYTTREGLAAAGADLIFDRMEEIVEAVLAGFQQDSTYGAGHSR